MDGFSFTTETVLRTIPDDFLMLKDMNKMSNKNSPAGNFFRKG